MKKKMIATLVCLLSQAPSALAQYGAPQMAPGIQTTQSNYNQVDIPQIPGVPSTVTQSHGNVEGLITGPNYSTNSEFNGLNYVEQNTYNIYVDQGQYSPGHQVPYANYLGWCSSFVSTINQTLYTARMMDSSGNKQGAVDALVNELNRQAAEINRFPMSPYPHTMIAIIESASIANQLVQAISQVPDTQICDTCNDPSRPWFAQQLIVVGMDPIMKANVQINALSQLVDVINFAYEELDNPYYQQIFNSCWGNNCYGTVNNGLIGTDYYRNMVDLANKFLTSYQVVDDYMADDIVELNIAKGFVNSSKTTLLSALGRRQLECEVRDLHFIEGTINYFLSPESGHMRTPDKVRIIRAHVDSVENKLSRYGCRY